MDVFSWSIPFVVEKVTEILLKTGDPKIVNEELKHEEEKLENIHDKLLEPEHKTLGSKADLLWKKVRAMSRMFKMLKTIREEWENLTKLRGPDGLIPWGLILEGAEAIHDAVE